MFDRMMCRGHLQMMTRILKDHIQQIAQKAGREVIYLNSAMTKARGKSKEDLDVALGSRIVESGSRTGMHRHDSRAHTD